MKTRVIVLAAGKSTRMNSDKPKVLEDLNGKPLIAHLLESVVKSGIDRHPVVVVGYHGDEVKTTLGDNCEYVTQADPRGTAHAVQAAEELLSGRTDSIVVLYGDQPYIKPETLRALTETHAASSGPITMATTTVDNFDGENSPFRLFGRIVRNAEGKITAIVEKKDATQDELKIREVNPGYYCFDTAWLWPNLKKVENNNAADEYYLTDLVRIAIGSGENIKSMSIDPRETIGVNTPEDLSRIREMA